MTTRIGVLTAGGDAPGLNAAIRAVVRTAIGVHGFEVLGFRKGWRGVMDGDVVELTSASVQGILHRGGTILGSSGADPYHEQGVERVRRTFADLGVDALVAIGGEGTMGAAAHMSSEGVPVVGIPKTIDNDLSGTDACIGFATAVQVATDAIDRLHTTAESHDRLMVVEVMGRSAGWIALSSGIAGGRRHDPAPRASVRPGRGRLGAPAPPPDRALVLDRGRGGGGDAGRGHDAGARVPRGPSRRTALRRDRVPDRPEARGADRLGVAGHGARSRPARRIARSPPTGSWRRGSGRRRPT